VHSYDDQVIIWLNGTFGCGKTSTAAELHSLVRSSRVFDPETVGYMLQPNLADRPVSDFQHWPPWHEQWIGDAPPLLASHARLLPAMTGDRVLDIACGQGRMSRYLARSGADVTGIDISAAMLGKARAAGPETITYIHADVARHPAWWDRRPFDGCTCELALMDIDDLAGTLSTVTAVLRPGGWFVASIVHPFSRQ
jgi:2-polyprenyl-3-methyl-5-hydroxy-6-metoxy-1,4-benzoquinol methylase